MFIYGLILRDLLFHRVFLKIEGQRNKINGKIYILGSNVNLSKRFKNYFNESYLSKLKDFLIIYKILLVYGFENFTLEIL